MIPNSISVFLQFLFSLLIRGGGELFSITVYIRFSKNESKLKKQAIIVNRANS
jgi:hypothetical protein